MKFNTNMLSRLIGVKVKNYEGEWLGEIAEVTEDITGSEAEYIILKSSVMFGRGNRFFAVPASSKVIKKTNSGRIVLQLSKDDLQFAKGVSADKCPKPGLTYRPTVFELYNYRLPAERMTNTVHAEH